MMIHFNPNKPENHNIYIPNMKTGFIMCWNGESWDIRNREDVIDDIYDESVIEKNNWLMYGSCKPGNKPYKLTKIYDYLESGNLKLIEEKDDNFILISKFSIRNCEKESLYVSRHGAR